MEIVPVLPEEDDTNPLRSVFKIDRAVESLAKAAAVVVAFPLLSVVEEILVSELIELINEL